MVVMKCSEMVKDCKKNNVTIAITISILALRVTRHDLNCKVISWHLLSTVTGKRLPIKSFCLAGSGKEKLVFSIVLKIK